MTNCIAILY